ncbi:uncharacterized protein LOC114932567 isoform X2 [Nylanderia fulva]|uniref:uncharacterized protein LOC114932567 isoform X2 n=1 Tax=Nylanderia fulva TaxID=613905 RepID=UPI0010FADCF8|nr:uncharacterized protein LOC114932567 isoform X2 [Nylanderia fulva]
MHWGSTLFLLCLLITLSHSSLFSVEKLKLFAKILKLDTLHINETENELWHGLFRDCDKRVTFSCIQKNAYTYLDNTFIERDNITIFDGLLLTRNNVTYDTCPKTENSNNVRENLVDDVDANGCHRETDEEAKEQNRKFEDEPVSPLQEITNALRQKTMKFLSTRNYQIQLPQFFFEGTTVKISPREIDETGALLRVDFGNQEVGQQEGRIFFKKIKKFVQNKLLTSFLALLLIIKLIKVKFLFIIPFLFGVGAAKKLFLKLLLFFIPAFAHIFKLCSSYYASHSTKFHHHHHQVAHHHHHVPVPVAVPSYYHRDDFNGYDYTHPHVQYRKDMEELKEWGIEPYDEPYEAGQSYEASQQLNRVVPAPSPVSGLSYSAGAHNLAYSGYLNDIKYNRRPAAQPTATVLSINPANLVSGTKTSAKNPYTVFAPNVRLTHQRLLTPIATAKSSSISQQETDDEYYGPIMSRLDDIFGQLRFYEETCREMLVCSMYKNPAGYSPHSNLVSNELSRDPQELKNSVTESVYSERFYRYVNAARHGQDGEDCLSTYPCNNTE